MVAVRSVLIVLILFWVSVCKLCEDCPMNITWIRVTIFLSTSFSIDFSKTLQKITLKIHISHSYLKVISMLLIPFHFVNPYRILIHFYISTFRIQISVCILNWEEIARISNCNANQTATNRARSSRSDTERS